jgi:UDP-N-acetylmuramoyl-tripeptide--D-alanyl-D-alanine ligase
VTIPFDARDVVRWSGAEQLRGPATARFSGVSIDTRTIGTGQLFVAISGSRLDAHDYLVRAVEGGAAGLLVERGRALPDALAADLPVLAADDTTRALGALAAGHRTGHHGPLVAITGSNGKTTTKEMCAAILGVAGPCLKNAGNLNNEFGLPLTLLRRDPCHGRVVVELGMNHRGEIARLAAIAGPTVGVITNVGTAHIEFLGSREEIAREKGDLVAALGADAVAVLNADDALVDAQAERTAARVLRFGLGPGADVRADGLRVTNGGYAFLLRAPEGSIACEVAGLGETAVRNALAAAAAALAAGVPLAEVAQGLARYRPVPGRLEPIALPGGGVVINDTYNANPQSTEIALHVLSRLAGRAGEGGNGSASRGIAVLGDMGELGDVTPDAHREAGRLAASLGIDRLYALGEYATELARGAIEAGMDPSHVHVSRSWEETGELVSADLTARDRVLVKGSRAMRMERIVEQLSHAAERRSEASGLEGQG